MRNIERRKARVRPGCAPMDKHTPGRQTGHMAARNSKRLAEAIEARRGELGITQAEFAERGGLALKTVSRLENGGTEARSTTLAAIDRAAGWKNGSAARILVGGEPEAEDTSGTEIFPRRPADFNEEVIRKPPAGPTVDGRPFPSEGMDPFADSLVAAYLKGGEELHRAVFGDLLRRLGEQRAAAALIDSAEILDRMSAQDEQSERRAQ